MWIAKHNRYRVFLLSDIIGMCSFMRTLIHLEMEAHHTKLGNGA